jgi:hypothetical protein
MFFISCFLFSHLFGYCQQADLYCNYLKSIEKLNININYEQLLSLSRFPPLFVQSSSQILMIFGK